MFNCAPEDPYTKWDKVWLDRARVILQGREQARLARLLDKRRTEEEKTKKTTHVD